MNHEAEPSIEDGLSGKVIWGDDFSTEALHEWYEDERQAYFDLSSSEEGTYRYQYHELNRVHGYDKISLGSGLKVLGLGAAYGEEFLPIIHRISHVTIVDPGHGFRSDNVHGVPAEYLEPNDSGAMSIESESMDLVTSFGTLHHIPNVSYVVSEIGRVLKKGGVALIREPVSSMGDWRKPRPGLTKRERGIPRHAMNRALDAAGLRFTASYCMFPLVPTLARRLLGMAPYENRYVTRLDRVLSTLLSWNCRYRRKHLWDKMAPRGMFWVARKSNG